MQVELADTGKLMLWRSMMRTQLILDYLKEGVKAAYIGFARGTIKFACGVVRWYGLSMEKESRRLEGVTSKD